MKRAAWSGYITVGQLGIPVLLHSALAITKSYFTVLHEVDGSPIERVNKCKLDGSVLKGHETVKAVKYENRYVTFTSQELDKYAVYQDNTIGVIQFTDAAGVEYKYFEKPYYVIPTASGERAYALLRDALVEHNLFAIATFVMRGKEHMCAIGVSGDIILLYQLRYASELIPRASLKTPAMPRPTKAEKDAMTAVISSNIGPFYAEDYHDSHSEYIAELVERKVKGLPMPRPQVLPASANNEIEIIKALQSVRNNIRPAMRAVKEISNDSNDYYDK